MPDSSILRQALPTSRLINGLLLVAIASCIVNQYLSQAAILALVLICLPALWRQPCSKPRDWSLAFCLIAIAAIPISVSSGSARPMDAVLRYPLLLLLLFTLPQWALSAQQLLRCISAAPIVASVLVLTFDLYPESRFKFVDETRYDFGLGLLDSAFAAALLMPMVVAQWIYDRGNWPWQLLALAGAAAIILIIIMSGTRASWLGLLAAPIISLAVLAPQRRKSLLASVAIGLMVVFLSYSMAPMVKERTDAAVTDLNQYFSSDEIVFENSLGLRLDLWKMALVCFSENPIVGASYQEIAETRRSLIAQGKVTRHIGEDGKGSMHSEVLDSLAKKGLLGLLALLILYYVPMRFFFRECRRARSQQQIALAAAGFASVVTVLVCGLAEAPLVSGRFAVLFALLMVVLRTLCVQARKPGG